MMIVILYNNIYKNIHIGVIRSVPSKLATCPRCRRCLLYIHCLESSRIAYSNNIVCVGLDHEENQ